MRAIGWRVDLAAIDIPLPEFSITYGYKVLRVYGGKVDMVYPALLLYNILAFFCLDIP